LDSNIYLRALPDELILPLNSIIKQPRFLDGGKSPNDHEYHPLQPSLQLFLSSNSLRELNPKLFKLRNITVLSLRNNDLETLSPHVAKLHNLVELNVAGNALRWLPYELLSVIQNEKIRTLTVLPNPLLRPFEYKGFLQDSQPVPNQFQRPVPSDGPESIKKKLIILRNKVEEAKEVQKCPGANREREGGADFHLELEICTWMIELYTRYFYKFRELASLESGEQAITEDIAKDDHVQHHPLFIASTPITYFNIDGAMPRGLRENPPPSLHPEDSGILPATPGTAFCTTEPRVPSLFELALLAASKVSELPMLHTLMPEESPPNTITALQTAVQTKAEGGRKCSVCNRRYVIPRTEWVEYWHIPPKLGQMSSKEEMFWPFLRRGCSLGCVPDRKELGDPLLNLESRRREPSLEL
jgi:hypothetical protein